MKRSNLYFGLFLLIVIIIALVSIRFLQRNDFLEGLDSISVNQIDKLYNNANIPTISNEISGQINNMSPSRIATYNQGLNPLLNSIISSNVYNNFSISNPDVKFITDIIRIINDENAKLLSTIIDQIIFILRELKGKIDYGRSYE